MLTELKKRLKKGRKRGFTLVEVIVVLVILAILAAIAVPALTGYIEKANQRAVISEARNVQVALQTLATDNFAGGGSAPTSSAIDGTTEISVAFPKYNATTTTASPKIADEIAALTSTSADKYSDAKRLAAIEYDASNALKGFKFNNGTFTATYKVENGKGTYEVKKEEEI